MSCATVTILYPSGSDINFDMSCPSPLPHAPIPVPTRTPSTDYLSSHMPMLLKSWKSYGLTNYTVSKPAEGPYVCICYLNFSSFEGFKKASEGPERKAIREDVQNYTNSKVVLVPAEVVGSV
jgi:uncharacterized protein (TIGR02118 family)